MQAHCLCDISGRQWIRAVVAAGLAIIPAARAAAPADMHQAFGQRPTTGYAFPAFSRQTGLACSSCHFQKYPALTPFGRGFKAAGFTKMGPQETVNGERLSLPSALNASIFLKILYQKTNGTDAPGERTTNAGELQFPDEFALLLGGRVSEHAGFVVEGQLANGSAPFVAAFKLPFTFRLGSSIRANVIPFSTDALGVAYGFELLNTGAVRNVRVNENRTAVSAQQYIGTATAAEGVAFVLVDPKWFVNVTTWSPNHFAFAEGVANGAPTALYLRAAFTPTVGNWDLGIGIQSWSGSAATANEAGTGVDNFATSAFAVDAQAQGAVRGLPLGLYFTHGKSGASARGADQNLFNSMARDRSASTVTAELGVRKNPRLTVLGAYRSADTGRAAANSGDDAITFGVNWMVAQNVGLHWTFTKFSGSAYAAGQEPMNPGGGGNTLQTFLLSAGF
ncbi:MAG: hypothetical protein WEA80_09710 [Gemmatimonadaceae bacterium]